MVVFRNRQRAEVAVNCREVADEIVSRIQDEKWYETRDKIEAKLGEAYRVGFLDGEASANMTAPPEDDDVTGVCV